MRTLPLLALLLAGCTAELVVGAEDTASRIAVPPLPGTTGAPGSTGTGTGGTPNDLDGDGYTADVDCDDSDAAVHPDAPERCDATDNNCDGQINDDGVCPCPHEVWQDRVYVFCETPLPWLEARDRCSSAGLQLVSFETEAEQDAVGAGLQMGDSSTWWIGLTDFNNEGTWEWVSGAPLTFDGWALNEPNNANNEDCAQLFTSLLIWNDVQCDNTYPFVCEGD